MYVHARSARSCNTDRALVDAPNIPRLRLDRISTSECNPMSAIHRGYATWFCSMRLFFFNTFQTARHRKRYDRCMSCFLYDTCDILTRRVFYLQEEFSFPIKSLSFNFAWLFLETRKAQYWWENYHILSVSRCELFSTKRQFASPRWDTKAMGRGDDFMK